MTVQVCEYATLTCAKNTNVISMDYAIISEATFDWLLDLNKLGGDGKNIVQISGRTELKLGSYVGYLESPSGESIEILPKTELNPVIETGAENMRGLLQKMLRVSLNIKHREAHEAGLLTINEPLHEWIFMRFLTQLAELIRRGLRFDYHTLEDEATFIRGQLDMNRQMRQTPDKATHFHVRYAEFTPSRIENRLLRTANQ